MNDDLIGIKHGYRYNLIEKISKDKGAELGLESSEWQLLLAAIKNGDELWTYYADSISPDTQFDSINGLAVVRDQKIVHQILLTAYNDWHF